MTKVKVIFLCLNPMEFIRKFGIKSVLKASFFSVFLGLLIIGSLFVAKKHYLGDKYYFGILISDSIVGKDFVVVDKEHSLKNLKGEILAFDFPLDTDYFKKGKSFAKYVKCEEGDLLENKSGKFYCNGEFIGGALPKDSKGNPVQDFKWNGIIPKDSFFVMGTHTYSFDSRYWGFVTKKDVKGVVVWLQ